MSRKRYLQKLREQMQFVQNSCKAYDLGLESEACRLALCMRVLFHQTKRSISLMSRLKLKDTTMLSSDSGNNGWYGYVSVAINLGSVTPVSSKPKLGNNFFPVPFHSWWDGQVVYQYKGRNYHRRQLVLVAANQDGGAHVDEKLEQFYEDLAGGTQGILLNGRNLVYPSDTAPYDQNLLQRSRNTHFAMIRQFSHEVIQTASHFRWFDEIVNSSI